MPKTTIEIIKDFTGKDEIDIHQFVYDIAKNNFALQTKDKKWFSEKEVNKLIESLSEANKEILHLKETGKFRCNKCGKNFKKIDKYTWKPTCECINKNLRLSVG